jgi:hypothetical protein
MKQAIKFRIIYTEEIRRKARSRRQRRRVEGSSCLCDDFTRTCQAEFPRGRWRESPKDDLDATVEQQPPQCCSHGFHYSEQQSLHRGHACDASLQAHRSRVRLQCLRNTSEPPTETILDDALLSILGGSSAASSPSTTQRPGGSLATRLAREAGLDRPTQSREMIESEKRSQYQRQIYRKWQPGDVYSPQDLSGAEQKKWKTGRKKPQSDAFDVLGINPVLEYKVGCNSHMCRQKADSYRTSQ